MIKVAKLLEKKGTEIWHIGPEDTVYKALEVMGNKGVGALCVLLNDELVGIISERDYARKVILKGRISRETKVKEIMTRHVYHSHPEQNIEECLVLMNEKRIRHLPVIDGTKIVGMISTGDVVKEIITEQKYTIKQLENYISWEESY
ncbi:MAG TPA: CBS domain-containing protein [Gammaproteobacteria bacterium]|nr:CBS domain-containing protein [Gammaproteobacteria bacterium]